MIARPCIVIVLLSLAVLGRARLGAPEPILTAEPLHRFPAYIGPWRGTDSPLDQAVVKVAAVDDHLNRVYASPAGELGLYVGYYQNQREGEALHSPLFCLPGAGWQPIHNTELRLDAARSPVAINQLLVERGLDRLLVLYWYQTVARVTAGEYARKLFLIKDAFMSGRTDVALVRIVAPVTTATDVGEEQALAMARPFAEQVLPELQARLFKEQME
jgi:EpsI family protein